MYGGRPGGRSRGLGVVVGGLGVFASLGILPAGSASAAPTDVVISELMYNPPSGVDGDEFLELTNPGATAVECLRLVLRRDHAVLRGRHHDGGGRKAGRGQGRGPFPADLRLRGRRDLHREPLQRRRDDHAEGRDHSHDRQRQLSRPGSLAHHDGRAGPVARADRPGPGQQRPGQLGGIDGVGGKHCRGAQLRCRHGSEAAYHWRHGHAERAGRQPGRDGDRHGHRAAAALSCATRPTSLPSRPCR